MKRELIMARALVRPLGFTLTQRDGEYRLAPIAGTPAEQEWQAVYTTDLEDAIGTAKLDAGRRQATQNAAREALRVHAGEVSDETIATFIRKLAEGDSP